MRRRVHSYHRLFVWRQYMMLVFSMQAYVCSSSQIYNKYGHDYVNRQTFVFAMTMLLGPQPLSACLSNRNHPWLRYRGLDE